MSEPFIYDSHYQVDKPLALLDLTIDTSSPTAHATDDSLARRLNTNAKKYPVQSNGQLVQWKSNDDQMRYWLGNCHSCELLSRQNSYDYWLMNFVWASSFSKKRTHWGEIEKNNSRLARLLLFRWAWVFDAPLIIGLSKKMQELGTCDVGAIVSRDSGHVEDVFVSAFSALLELSTNPRDRTAYRSKRDEIGRGFKYNTRRHKVCTHFGLLVDSGLTLKTNTGETMLHSGFSQVLASFGSVREAVNACFGPGPLGRGSALFCDIVQRTFDCEANVVSEMDDRYWVKLLPEIKEYWHQIQKWDRKFLGIRALSELFLVKNMISGIPVTAAKVWQDYLSRRARAVPEELTVHVDRFGRVEFLKLN